MRALSWVMRDRRRYAAALRAARAGSAPLRALARRRGGTTVRRLPWPLSGWTAQRDAPLPAAESFRDWWRRTRERP
jgi:L-lactate dehydrogenase complex protein LldF